MTSSSRVGLHRRLERMKKHVLIRRTEKDSAGFKDRKEKNEWILNKAGVKRELLDTVKARKLAYYGHTMRKHGTGVAWRKR